MSSLIECLEWENKFALDSAHQFDWKEWIAYIVEIAQLPVYNINSICDVSLTFNMARHAKYYNNTLQLQNMYLANSLQKCLEVVHLRKYFQQQYFMQALYHHCSKYTIGMKTVSCPNYDHMSNVPVVPYTIFHKLNSLLDFPPQLYMWLYNAIVCKSEQPFVTHIALHTNASISGRRKRKQKIMAMFALACEDVQNDVTEQLELIHSLSPNCAPQLTCIATAIAAKYAEITLNAKQTSDAL